MSFTAAEVESLKTGIDVALESRRFTAWQVQFLTDLRARFARYGTRTRLTLKQTRTLHELLDSASAFHSRIPVGGYPGGGPYRRSSGRRRYTSFDWMLGRARTVVMMMAFCIAAMLLLMVYSYLSRL